MPPEKRKGERERGGRRKEEEREGESKRKSEKERQHKCIQHTERKLKNDASIEHLYSTHTRPRPNMKLKKAESKPL